MEDATAYQGNCIHPGVVHGERLQARQFLSGTQDSREERMAAGEQAAGLMTQAGQEKRITSPKEECSGGWRLGYTMIYASVPPPTLSDFDTPKPGVNQPPAQLKGDSFSKCPFQPPRLLSDKPLCREDAASLKPVSKASWASLVAQWLRVCLPVRETRVRALVWEDPTCRGATGPVSHNY